MSDDRKFLIVMLVEGLKWFEALILVQIGVKL